MRPREHVFDLAWEPPDQEAIGGKLVAEYGIHTRTDCTTCHR